MSQALTLRSAPSGGVFVGDADGDALIWDATLQKWRAGAVVGGVASVFGRTGVVVALTGDYDSDQIDNLSGVAGATVSDALDTLALSAGAVASVFGRSGVVVAVTNDYAASQVQNDSSVAGAGVKGALNTLLAAIAALTTGVSSVFGRAGAVTAAAGDYTSTQITNSSNVNGATATAALNYFAQAAAAVAGGATPALPFATNRYQKLTLDQNATPTVTVPPAGVEVLLEVVQGGVGSFTITWPASFRWTDDVPPVLTTTAGKRDLIRAISNGTQLLGWAQGMNMSA